MGTGKIDRPFLIALLVLAGVGTLMVYSASMYTITVSNSSFIQVFKQFFYAIFGIICMLVISRLDYRKLNKKRLVQMLFLITLVLLVVVRFTPLGVEVNGGKRWLDLKILTVQPSELAKFTGILYLTELLTRKPEVLGHHKSFLKEVACPAGLLLFLIVIEPSLSATLAVAAGLFAVLYFSGIRFKLLLPYVFLIIPVLAYLLIETPWRLTRILSFATGTPDYQVAQSLLGIGSGGIFGTGLGNGKQKLLFLPEVQNDFIFANIGEEFGLIGCVLLISLYFFIIYRGFKIALAAPDRFGFLYTSSVIALLAFQVFINIGVATNTLPVTGIALPFISAGGTSIIMLFVMFGPILNISKEVNLSKKKRAKK